MESSHEDGDDHFNIISGDLGVGESTKSASFVNFELLNIGHGHSSLSVSDSCLHTHFRSLNHSSGLQNNNSIHDTDVNLFEKKLLCDMSSERTLNQDTLQKANRISVCAGDSQVDKDDFPTYADVPYGTSLRQQKKLFEQQNISLRQQFAASLSGNVTESGFKKRNWNSWRNNSLKLSVKEIETKLILAVQEMEELKIELDACQKRLDAKYKAVAILKQQADLADSELKVTERKAVETRKSLEQHGDGMEALVVALDDSALEHISLEMLKLELERVCQDNAILMSKLETRNEELRRANAHKSAIARERDELLALLDITERLKYEQGKSRGAEEEYSTFTSSELAVLGACRCRVSSPEPCGCAHAAANLRKEVTKLKEEIELSQKRREESNLTVDAYRTAFEEQLAKTRNLCIRLSQIATISSRAAKAKAAIKWLIQFLNDDDYVPPKSIEQGMEAEKGNNLSNMSIQEMITVLTEMVHEKNEALAHQKLAAQVLTNKLYIYEKKAGKSSEVIDIGTDPKPHRHKKKQNKICQIPLDSSNSEHSDAKNSDKNYDFHVSSEKLLNVDEVYQYVVHPCKEDDSSVIVIKNDSACTSEVENTTIGDYQKMSNNSSESQQISEDVLPDTVSSVEDEEDQQNASSTSSTHTLMTEEVVKNYTSVENNHIKLNGCNNNYERMDDDTSQSGNRTVSDRDIAENLT